MKNDSGFTLVELLIVVAITAVLSALTIVYSNIGQNQVALSVESEKIAQLILQAKQLSLATYSQSPTTCAYGVHFNFASSTYSLFVYNSAAINPLTGNLLCPSSASTTASGLVTDDIKPYESGSWEIHVQPGVVMESSSSADDVLADVLFFPPDPLTLMSRMPASSTLLGYPSPSPASKVYLETSDGSAARTVSVDAEGQVDF